MRLSRAQVKAEYARRLLERGLSNGHHLTVVLATQRLERAVRSLPADDPLRAQCLALLAEPRQVRWQASGSLGDLDELIEARQAAAAHDQAPEEVAVRQHDLANSLRIKFERSGHLADINAAVSAARAALASVSETDALRPRILSMLGLALWLRFGVSGVVGDVNEGVRYCQEAADTCPLSDEVRPGILTNLANGLLRRFERLGRPADLDSAVTAIRTAATQAPADNRDRAVMLVTLSNALRFRAELTGDLADLDEAVDAGQQAVAANADGRAGGLPLSTAALALLRRYERRGTAADLDRAVDLGWLAVQATKADDPMHALYLTNVGGSLLRRFQLTGASDDLDASLDANRQAADAAVGVNKPRFLGNLSNTLQDRFIRTQQREDIDRALAAATDAIKLAPADDANLPSYFNSLANSLRLRSQHTGDTADLDTAAEFGERALSRAPAGSPVHAMLLGSLSGTLLLRGQPTDIDRAVELSRQAATAAPDDSPVRAAYLNLLIGGLTARFKNQANQADQHDGYDAGRQAVSIATAAAAVRVQAALGWGQLAVEAADWAEAVDAYTAAAELLPLLTARSLARPDQEFQLAQIAGFGPRAAACCLEANRPDLAVELLEQGRGVLLAQAFGPRDLTELSRQHPDLAKRFAAQRNLLEAGASDIETLRQQAREHEAIVAEIRRLPGFASFLLPPRSADLLRAAARGAVVLVNVSDIRCDALLVTSAGVTAVRLPDLSLESARDRLAQFLIAVGTLMNRGTPADDLDSAEAAVRGVLSWLWTAIAAPVLAELRPAKPASEDGPWDRIWWCPSGLLSFLPLHAAGDHETCFDETPRTVLDRVISSYTPTLRALLHARRPAESGTADSSTAERGVTERGAVARGATRSGTAGDGADRLLLVAMPQTPGFADLPGTPAEAESLQARFAPRFLALTGEGTAGQQGATYDSVSAALPGYPLAHFACHAASRLDNPSASFLVLKDYADRPLTVLSIEQLHLDRAELAFLSACSTARTGLRLPDESINLASAFQLAGFRRVIATLWPVDDRIAVRLADRFYQNLQAAGTADSAAAALHRAVRRLRRTHVDQPSMWAAHIHSGS
jgi:tetratricopeptide (TPR) repeat protein